MDYEKKYNEAVERARELAAKWTGKNKDFFIGDYAYIFPELRESEDERIRKELIDQVQYIIPEEGEYDEEGLVLSQYYDRINRYRAYLEKQKEPKHAPDDLQKSFEAGQTSIVDNTEQYGLCKKAEWSEEDIDKMVNERARKSGTTKTEMQFYRQGIEDTLKNFRPSWKPSKKQIEELWNVISYIEKPDSNFLGVPALLESLYEQLKKLM